MTLSDKTGFVDALVDCVELLSGGVLLKQLAGDLSLGGEDNSILG